MGQNCNCGCCECYDDEHLGIISEIEYEIWAAEVAADPLYNTDYYYYKSVGDYHAAALEVEALRKQGYTWEDLFHVNGKFVNK